MLRWDCLNVGAPLSSALNENRGFVIIYVTTQVRDKSFPEAFLPYLYDTQYISQYISMTPKNNVRLTAFETQIKLALKLFDKPQSLGEESALASYYFLSQAFDDSADVSSPLGRGVVLQRELQRATDALWGDTLPASREEFLEAITVIRETPGTPKYAYVVLELRCFQRYMKLSRLADIWEEYLPSSRAEHYRDFDSAVTQLGQQLLRRVQPSFRLEAPLPPEFMIGYHSQIEQCLGALRTGQSVTLHGPGGVGKSAVAATVVASPELGVPFWFTIRPRLNDRLENLLFSLGYFLHRQNRSHLWNMLLLSNGKVDDLNLAMGLVREDLASLANNPVIVCFDEIEQLKLSAPEQIEEGHLKIQHFIESLQGYVPMLLIGQRPMLLSDSYIELTGLSSPYISQLYQREGILLDNDEVQKLFQYTNGNPRLLLLYKLLYQKGEPWGELLNNRPQAVALQPILNRLWLRLERSERRLLQQLSVFQSAAPIDHWQDHGTAIQQLVQFRLIQLDGLGGLSVVTALRSVIYESLTIERREQLHLEASDVCLVRAEYTRAAYHFWQGGDANKAVEVWYAHRQHEIAHGQALVALKIFEAISHRQLKPQQRKALGLIRAELFQLQGEAREGLAALELSDWSSDAETSLRAQSLRGIFLDELGYPERAIESYRQGQVAAHRLLSRLANFHYWTGVAYFRQHEKQEAWKEAHAAQYNALSLIGNLHEQEGQYEEAIEQYAKALALAQKLDLSSVGTVHRFLSSVCGRQGRFSDSIQHATRAIEIYQEIGDRLNLEIVHSYLAATYLEMGQFEDAAQVATKALRFFRQIDNKHFVATTGATAAEAYFELQDDAQATELAYEVLAQEEPYAYAYAHYTLGLIMMRQKELDRAQHHLTESVGYAEKSEDRFIEAYARRMLGRLFAEQQMANAAHESLTIALRLFGHLGLEHEVAQTEAIISEGPKFETN